MANQAVLAPVQDAGASSISNNQAIKLPAFLLFGDGTMSNMNGGGWSVGFLHAFQAGALGLNKSVTSATIKSCIEAQYCAEALSLAETYATNGYDVYVLIQFGYNDQKPESMPEFKANLERLAQMAIEYKVTPLLVTPLTRRNFDGNELVDDLSDTVAAIREASLNAGVALIDLNAASRKFIEAIGSAEADKLNLTPTERTYLNPWGSMLFGRMVAELVFEQQPKLRLWTAT